MAAQKISLNGQLTVNGYSTVNAPVIINLITSGSNVAVLTPNVTSSWQLLDQGNCRDFYIGVFTNTDTTSSIYIAQGSTASYAALLTPLNDTCVLTNSGALNLYAKSSGSNASPQLSYTIVGML